MWGSAVGLALGSAVCPRVPGCALCFPMPSASGSSHCSPKPTCLKWSSFRIRTLFPRTCRPGVVRDAPAGRAPSPVSVSRRTRGPGLCGQLMRFSPGCQRRERGQRAGGLPSCAGRVPEGRRQWCELLPLGPAGALSRRCCWLQGWARWRHRPERPALCGRGLSPTDLNPLSFRLCSAWTLLRATLVPRRGLRSLSPIRWGHLQEQGLLPGEGLSPTRWGHFQEGPPGGASGHLSVRPSRCTFTSTLVTRGQLGGRTPGAAPQRP